MRHDSRKPTLAIALGLGMFFFGACAGKKTVEGDLAEKEGKIASPAEPGATDVPTETAKADAPAKEADKTAEPVAAKEDAKPAPAEAGSEPEANPGSLWSETSHWNRIFSIRGYRGVGDTIVVLPTEKFRTELSEKVAAVMENQKGTTHFEERSMLGAIREKAGEGRYRIVATYPLRFAGEPVEAELSGIVRENEIAPDDTVSTDVMHELKIAVRRVKKGAADESADAKPADAASTASTVGAPAAKADGKAAEPKKEKIVKKIDVRKESREKKKRDAIGRFEKGGAGKRVAAAKPGAEDDKESEDD